MVVVLGRQAPGPTPRRLVLKMGERLNTMAEHEWTPAHNQSRAAAYERVMEKEAEGEGENGALSSAIKV